VTQPTYPLPLYPFYYIFSFTQLFKCSIRPTFPFPIFIFRTIYSSKYFPLKNKQSLFFLLRHRPWFLSDLSPVSFGCVKCVCRPIGPERWLLYKTELLF
jgi:hypothetical protein